MQPDDPRLVATVAAAVEELEPEITTRVVAAVAHLTTPATSSAVPLTVGQRDADCTAQDTSARELLAVRATPHEPAAACSRRTRPAARAATGHPNSPNCEAGVTTDIVVSCVDCGEPVRRPPAVARMGSRRHHTTTVGAPGDLARAQEQQGGHA